MSRLARARERLQAQLGKTEDTLRELP